MTARWPFFTASVIAWNKADADIAFKHLPLRRVIVAHLKPTFAWYDNLEPGVTRSISRSNSGPAGSAWSSNCAGSSLDNRFEELTTFLTVVLSAVLVSVRRGSPSARGREIAAFAFSDSARQHLHPAFSIIERRIGPVRSPGFLARRALAAHQLAGHSYECYLARRSSKGSPVPTGRRIASPARTSKVSRSRGRSKCDEMQRAVAPVMVGGRLIRCVEPAGKAFAVADKLVIQQPRLRRVQRWRFGGAFAVPRCLRRGATRPAARGRIATAEMVGVS